MRVSQGSNRPFLVAVSSHWVSLTGLALALTALISWMFVLPVHVRGHAGNPYIGVLVFIVISVIFFAGLALIPLGAFWVGDYAFKRRASRASSPGMIDRPQP